MLGRPSGKNPPPTEIVHCPLEQHIPQRSCIDCKGLQQSTQPAGMSGNVDIQLLGDDGGYCCWTQSLACPTANSLIWLQEEIVAWVRRRSSAFSRGRSRFRGVSGQAGHWEARIGTFGNRKNARPPSPLSSWQSERHITNLSLPARSAFGSVRPSSCACRCRLNRAPHIGPGGAIWAKKDISKAVDCSKRWVCAKVSFGIHETEEEAAQQYDRALIVEKGRAAKTNYPITTYDEEVQAFEAFVAARWGVLPASLKWREVKGSLGNLIQ